MTESEEVSAVTVIASDPESCNVATGRMKRRILRMLRRAVTAAFDARAKVEAYKTAVVRAEEAEAVVVDDGVLSLTRRAVLQALEVSPSSWLG